MSELRARAGDLCMCESMPFQQHFEYRTTWPLRDILHDKFFLDMRSSLRSGDSITLCRYDGVDTNHKGIRLLEVATVRVIASGVDSDRIPLALLGEIGSLAAQDTPPAPPLEISVGKHGRHRLMQGAKIVSEFGSRSEAEAELKRLVAA